MEILKIILTPFMFVVGLFVIMLFAMSSISATEISRSGNVSDTLHQAIENIALDELLMNLDEDAKKDFISVVTPQGEVNIKQNIRMRINEYLKSFPDICLNTSEVPVNSATITHNVITGKTLPPLKIEVFRGSYRTSGSEGYNKYTQTNNELPWIKITNDGNSNGYIDAFYIPSVSGMDGNKILPIKFQVGVETRHMFSDDENGDTRDKVSSYTNSSSGKKLDNSIPSEIDFSENASDIKPSITYVDVDYIGEDNLASQDVIQNGF